MVIPRTESIQFKHNRLEFYCQATSKVKQSRGLSWADTRLEISPWVRPKSGQSVGGGGGGGGAYLNQRQRILCHSAGQSALTRKSLALFHRRSLFFLFLTKALSPFVLISKPEVSSRVPSRARMIVSISQRLKYTHIDKIKYVQAIPLRQRNYSKLLKASLRHSELPVLTTLTVFFFFNAPKRNNLLLGVKASKLHWFVYFVYCLFGRKRMR